jgi:hypothetical protein
MDIRTAITAKHTALTDWFMELRQRVITVRYGLDIYI